MIELLKVSWEFLRTPTSILDKYIRIWPLQLGVALYLFFSLQTVLTNANVLNIQFDLLITIFTSLNLPMLYLFNILSALLTMLSLWYIQPIIASWLSPISKDEFDKNLFRKLILFAPTGYVIYQIIFIIPLKILPLIIAQTGSVDITKTVFLGVIVFIDGFLGLFGLAFLFMIYVITWKGLAHFFKMNTWQILLVEFIFPFILSLPIIIFMYPQLIEFFKNYIN